MCSPTSSPVGVHMKLDPISKPPPRTLVLLEKRSSRSPLVMESAGQCLYVVVLVVVGFDLHVFINACFSSFRLHILGHVSLVPFFSLHICTDSREKEGEGDGAVEAVVNRIGE